MRPRDLAAASVCSLLAGCPSAAPRPASPPVVEPPPPPTPDAASPAAPPPLVLDQRVEDRRQIPRPSIYLVFPTHAPMPKLPDADLPRAARSCARDWHRANDREAAARRALGEAREREDDRAIARQTTAAERAMNRRRTAADRCIAALTKDAPSPGARLLLAALLADRARDLEWELSHTIGAEDPSIEIDRERAIAEAARCEDEAPGTAEAAACAWVAGQVALELGDDAASAAAFARAIPGLPTRDADKLRAHLANVALGHGDPVEAMRLAGEITTDSVASGAAWMTAAAGWALGDCDAVWRAGAVCRAATSCDVAQELAAYQAICLADPAAGADRATRLPALDPGATIDPAQVATMAQSFELPAEPVARLRDAVAGCAHDRLGAVAKPIELAISGTTDAPVVTAPPGAPAPVAAIGPCATARYVEGHPAGEPRALEGRIVVAP